MIKLKRFQLLFVSFFALFAYSFYEARFISESLLHIAVLGYVLVAVVISIPYFFPKRKIFAFPVQIFVVAIAFSMLMAYVSWGQSIKNSFSETLLYLIWIFFFYLVHTKVPLKTVEKIIVTYAVIYIILYFFQLANSPTVIFGTAFEADQYTMDRGIIRIIFPGGGLFVLAAFMAVNKITTLKRKKAAWIILAIFGLLIPILQVTRIFIAGVLLLYIYHFMQKQSLVRKVAVFAVAIASIVYVANMNNKLVKGLKTASTNDAKEGQEYVRVRAGTYFINDFSPNIASRIFGNGAPYTASSDYGQTLVQLNKSKGYYIEDVGIIGMYAMFGILAVIAYLIIWYRSFTLKIPKEFVYVKYYLWYLLISCLTTDNVFHPSYVVATIFALYIFQVAYEKQLLADAENSGDSTLLTRR